MDNNKISKITFACMIAVALFFDAIQFGANFLHFIPVIGTILALVISSGVSIFAWLTFFLWFRLAGTKFVSKIAATQVGTFFIEMIPALNSLPAWTLSIVVIFLFFQPKEILNKVAPKTTKLAGKVAGIMEEKVE